MTFSFTSITVAIGARLKLSSVIMTREICFPMRRYVSPLLLARANNMFGSVIVLFKCNVSWRNVKSYCDTSISETKQLANYKVGLNVILFLILSFSYAKYMHFKTFIINL